MRRPDRTLRRSRECLRRGALTVCAAIVAAGIPAGCRSRTPVTDGSWKAGYSILYEVFASEADVDKLLWLKSVGEDVDEVVEGCVALSQAGMEDIQRFAERDKGIRPDTDPQHPIESEARAAIETVTAWELVTSTGREFETRMLLAQIEALRYVVGLCGALAEHETDEERRDFVERTAARAGELHKKAMQAILSRVSQRVAGS